MAGGPLHSRRTVLEAIRAGTVLGGTAAPDPSPLRRSPPVRWVFGTDTSASIVPVAAGPRHVYALTANRLLAVTRETGRPEWELREDSLVPGQHCPDSATLYVSDPGRTAVYAIDSRSGRVRWRFEGGVDPVAVTDRVHVVGNALYAITASDGTAKWAFQPNGEPLAHAASPGTAFVGTDRGTLHAVRSADGSQRWRFDVPASTYDDGLRPIAVRPTAGNGTGAGGAVEPARTVYVWDTSAFRLLAVSAADGSRRWTYELEEGSPVFFPGTFGPRRVYLRDGETLVWLAAADGTVARRVSLPVPPTRGRAVLEGDDAVFVGARGSVTAVPTDDGNHRWTYRTSRTEPVRLAGLSAEALTAYARSDRRATVYRLDLPDGDLRWRFETPDATPGPPLVDRNTVFAGTAGGELYALSDPGPGPLATVLGAVEGLGPPVLGAGIVAGATLLGAARWLRAGNAGAAERVDGRAGDVTRAEIEPLERTSSGPLAERFTASLPGRDEPVAFVRLRGDAGKDPDLVAAFESAIETASGLDVDGVPEVIATGTTPGPWVVTEQPRGGSLASRATDMALGEVLDALAAAARVVHAAHRQGATHGRLTPESVRFAGEEPSDVQVTGWQLPPPGTHSADPFAAPEQAADGRSTPGTRTDVYRLGAVAYWAVTGCPPRGPAPGPAGAETTPTSPTDIDPGLQPELDRRLLRALSVRPGERFGSAGEFADALAYGVPRERG